MVTIKDVARRADVSVGTVSLTINGSTLIKPETKKKVFDAIDELGYKMNFSARSLVTKKNMLIAAINLKQESRWSYDFSMSAMVDTYMLEMLKSISYEVQQAGYSLILEEMFLHDDGTADHMPKVYNRNRIDGALFIGGMKNDWLAGNIISSDVPTVLIGSRDSQIDWIDADHTEGIERLVDELVKIGHRDIVFVNGPHLSHTTEKKTLGYIRGLQKNNIRYREEWVTYTNFTGTDAYNAIRSVWESGIRPTAVLAATDCMTLGILNYFSDIGLKCPNDISVTGYEHGILSTYSVPPLMTMSVNKHKLGTEGTKMLLRRIEDPLLEPQNIVVHPELIQGKSVAKPRV